VKALLVFGITLVTGLAVAEHGHSCTRPASLGPTEPRAAVAARTCSRDEKTSGGLGALPR
jgi:hypothetical protein